MKTYSILRTLVAALLIAAGLQTAQAQGIRVHYKDGNTVDVPAALFDHMSPFYVKTTVTEEEYTVKVEPLNIQAANFYKLLEQKGMPLYIGLSAPTVNGTYKITPTQLVDYWSSDPEKYGDIDVDEEVEEVIKFADQSGNNVWIDTYNIDEDGPDINMGADEMLGDSRGCKSLILGYGNKFTAAYMITLDYPTYDIYVHMAYIISGEVSGSNLKDVYIATVSLDRDNNIVEYGIGKDGDGVSTTTTWAPRVYQYESRQAVQTSKASRLVRRLAPKRATTVTETWGYTIYKTDGTELDVTREQLDYVETYEGEFDERITQQIPQQYLEQMTAHMPIYSGNTPPTIDGTFTCHPVEMVFASDNYKTTNGFGDQIMNFSDQNKNKNTVYYQYKQGNGQSEKTEMIVLGQDDKFTIFAVMNGSNGDATYKMAEIVSGTMTADGIKDFFNGILMLEKNDPSNKIMDVGTYRIFKDGDGLAIPSTWSSRSMMPQQESGGLLERIAAE